MKKLNFQWNVDRYNDKNFPPNFKSEQFFNCNLLTLISENFILLI